MSFTFLRVGFQPVTISRGMEQSSVIGTMLRNTQGRTCGDGSRIGYSLGPRIIQGNLIFRLVTRSEADYLRDFLLKVVRFQKEFSITPDSFADIGLGVGAALNKCYWNGSPDTREYIRSRGNGGKFDIEFPFYSLDYASTEEGIGLDDQDGTP